MRRQNTTENIPGSSNFFAWGFKKVVAVLEAILPCPNLSDAIGHREYDMVEKILAVSPAAEDSENNEYLAALSNAILSVAPLWIIDALLARGANPAQETKTTGVILSHCEAEHAQIALTLILLHENSRQKALTYFDAHPNEQKKHQHLIQQIKDYTTALSKKNTSEAIIVLEQIKKDITNKYGALKRKIH